MVSRQFQILFVLGLVGCGSSDSSPSQPDGGAVAPDGGAVAPDGGLAVAPTYYQDVAPILAAKCVSCHSVGNIAPFSLDGPQWAQSEAEAIKESITARRMPPWPPGPLSPAMLHARSLSAAELAILSAWADAKAPLGDPAKPAPGAMPDVVDIGTADIKINTGVDYVPDPALTDDYRCFLVDVGATANAMITGYRITPGNAKTVHHVITTLFSAGDRQALEAIDAETPDRAGWSCFGGAVPADSPLKADGSLGAWVPGVSSVVLPKGTGTVLRVGDVAVVQIHYNVLGGKGSDRTSIELKLAPKGEALGLQQLSTIRLAKRDLNLPANQSSIVQEATLTAKQWMAGKFYADGQAEAVMVAGHMHTLGTHVTLEQRNAKGTTILLDIPAWDFHWQGSYLLAKPISIQADDQLTVRCTYENTAAQRQASGWEPGVVTDIKWGEGTHDEMCIGYVTVVNQPLAP